jgi:hypothetical protein
VAIDPESRDTLESAASFLRGNQVDEGWKRTFIKWTGGLGPRAKRFVPLLIESLVWPGLKRSAVVTLGEIGPDAKAALPALIDILNPEDPIRGEMLPVLGSCLMKIVPAGSAPEPLLDRAMARAHHVVTMRPVTERRRGFDLDSHELWFNRYVAEWLDARPEGSPEPPSAGDGPHPPSRSNCTICSGSGKETCGTCGGTGYTIHNSYNPDHGPIRTPCGVCGGSGKVTCFACGGSGKVH